MGNISDYLRAARSDGDRVNGFMSVTNVDALKGVNNITSIFRWIHFKYYDTFTQMTWENGLEHYAKDILSQQLYSEFLQQFRRVCTKADMVTIKEALAWTLCHAHNKEKKKMVLAYVAEPGGISAEEEINAHMGKSWNCMLSSDYKEATYDVDLGGNKTVTLDILNRSMDTYEVLLTTTKER